MTAVIGATHVLCSIGNGTEQAWASARAGIARISTSRLVDRRLESIAMGLVPDAALGALVPEIEGLPLPERARRMLRLAAPSFHAVARDLAAPVVLCIGLPELIDRDARWTAHVPAYLQSLTGVRIDRERSVVVARGRAAGLLALERAMELLQAEAASTVVVGGVDSFFDLRLLDALDGEGRVLGPGVMDGFIPGEGAAFYALSDERAVTLSGTRTRIRVDAVASVDDPGHRYGDAPARGEGLASALEQLRQRLHDSSSRIATTFAGFNGESFDAKLWGVARVRHHDFFSPDMVIEHPADKFGDAGAAMGAILVALAAQSLAGGTRPGPALVWAASDHEPRACAVVSAAPPATKRR